MPVVRGFLTPCLKPTRKRFCAIRSRESDLVLREMVTEEIRVELISQSIIQRLNQNPKCNSALNHVSHQPCPSLLKEDTVQFMYLLEDLVSLAERTVLSINSCKLWSIGKLVKSVTLRAQVLLHPGQSKLLESCLSEAQPQLLNKWLVPSFVWATNPLINANTPLALERICRVGRELWEIKWWTTSWMMRH
jgi:hypothetical protein